MNILIIAPFCPYPPNQGGKIRVFNLIKYLSRQNRITLACLSAEKIEDFGPLAEYCEKIVCVERPARTAVDLARFLLGKEPYNSLLYESDEFRQSLTRLCQVNSFDMVQLEFPLLWQYADCLAGLPMVLDAHNVEYEIIGNLRHGCTNTVKKALYRIEEKRFRQREEAVWEECRFCFAVSEQERATIASRVRDPQKVVTVPNGVDLERFAWHFKEKRGKRILFLGGMNWNPNLDAARYFVEKIFPLIHARKPDAEIDFVGKDLGKIRQFLPARGIRLHEHVTEVLPWFQQADVLVVPLRQGGGTRIKILEAMAAGLPVVTTSKGCEVIDIVRSRHLLVGDSAEEFANHVTCLIENDSLAGQLAQEARELVEAKYTWEMAAAAIHAKLSSLR